MDPDGLENFSLVGLSMGGSLNIEYAALHPDKVKSLVLFEPGGLSEKVDSQFIVWLYIKIPGMLRMLNRKYIKKDHAAMRKLLESIYVGGSKPTNPDRLTSILEKQSEIDRAVKLVIDRGIKAELEVIPNAGHMLPLERPEQANAAVKVFLDKTNIQ
ncbi:alpha/beta fold hydrolase [Acetobacterium bakii]|uniref:alpha/beta fold hydrolase n=1 Tax=Acetobacterium bakii TaxID=52689 RepID=UPI0024203A33|nr:alpha/beta hydrolase [Acetobacterium bakii]